MRGALLSLLRSCTCPTFPQLAVEAIIALNNSEANSIVEHALQTSASFTSTMFSASVVSEEVVPAGAFLIIIRDVIEDVTKRAHKLSSDQIDQSISCCFTVMYECHEQVFSALKSRCPCDMRWEDPRTTMCEAWFLAVNSLLTAFKTHSTPENGEFCSLIGRSMALCIHLIMSIKVEKEYSSKGIEDGLVCVEGPQSLAMIEFLALALLTKDIFISTATHCHGDFILDGESLNGNTDPSYVGGAIISAAILRSVSGGLPPWTVEYMPNILKSLYEACGGVDSFCLAMAGGCDVRLCRTSVSLYNDIAPGKKLAGFFLDVMKSRARDSFLFSLQESFTKKDDNQVWRFLKVILKSNCGEFP